MKVVTNPWLATAVTLVPGLALAFGGYANIWPLFGASNQLLGGMTMITIAVFCKATGRKGFMLYVPVAFLLACTFTSLVQSALGCVTALQAGGMAVMATSGLHLPSFLWLWASWLPTTASRSSLPRKPVACRTKSLSGLLWVPLPTRPASSTTRSPLTAPLPMPKAC